MDFTHLTKAGATALEKHMASCTRPFVAPRDEGFGAFSLTSIMLALEGRRVRKDTTIFVNEDTDEYPRQPILDMTSTIAIPVQSMADAVGEVMEPVGSSRPHQAMMLRKGMARNV
jgi:hypothetical protein